MNASTFNFRRALCALALLLAAGLLSACETTGSGAPEHLAAAKTPEPPMTRTHAAELCWMATEKSDGRMNLDKRADIVDKCIAEKLNGKKTAAVTPEKPKAKPAPEIKPKSEKPKAEITPHPSPKPKAKPKTDDKPEAEPKADDGAEPKPKG